MSALIKKVTPPHPISLFDMSENVRPSRNFTLTEMFDSHKILGTIKKICTHHKVHFLKGTWETPIPPRYLIVPITIKTLHIGELWLSQ